MDQGIQFGGAYAQVAIAEYLLLQFGAVMEQPTGLIFAKTVLFVSTPIASIHPFLQLHIRSPMGHFAHQSCRYGSYGRRHGM